MLNTLPKELSFINLFRLSEHTLEHASWRISDFIADVWECLFGTTRTTIDFRKVLDDGSLLTDSKNRELLDSIKKFLCLQTHPALTGSVVLAPATARMRIALAIATLDYFLLRSDEFQIAKHGFRFVTANDVMGLIAVIASHRSPTRSIYEPKSRILSYLSQVQVPASALAKLQKTTPDLFELAEDEELSLSRKQTLVARAWLKLHDCYVPSTSGTTEYRFYLEYAEPIVDYYLTLARKGGDIHAMAAPIPSKLAALGVVKWRSNATTADEFFGQLRRNECLFNMLEVLYGAIAVMVNTLMARRVSELEDLRADSIVEEHGTYFLAFNLRKANVLEHRKRTLRPVPAIAAEALKLLARLSQSMRDLGYQNDGKLFAIPYSGWQRKPPHFGVCQPDFTRFFDRFCDYFQTVQDERGRRYYVRAHQLRRNFAMLFFWQGSFGGVEVLRYFLGHNKPQMIYRYVTEAVPGKILRRVMASVAKDLIKAEHPATDELAALICERYGISLNDLHILPERDVVDYVEDLITAGEAEVKPEFFRGPKGQEYRIVYRVMKHREEA
ncbi:hypothetical protein P0D69_13130 [Paraburkholderia sediminicola]|uniref:hypothetical protein n=1 Tax=Paraburkholderia sediminicola TaxID=458836 RepID=UPI0038BA9658